LALLRRMSLWEGQYIASRGKGLRKALFCLGLNIT